jgi:Domain of unknown function (DUF4266)
MKFIKISRIIFLFLITFSVISCTHAKTWELENLKKPEMSLDQNTLEKKVSDHIDRSKETSASVSVDGSGCSCY